MRTLARQVHAHLKQTAKAVVIPHPHPDGDALGAATALFEYLTGLGRPTAIYCATPHSPQLKFLPHSERLETNPGLLADPAVDTVILVDSGDLRYAGVAELLVKHPAKIINIDHHATNEHFGHFNLVNPAAASTTEILFHYFRANQVHLSHRMATALLTGLTTDTGNFTNAATSATALAVGGELIRAGADLRQITRATIHNKTVGALKLWGQALSRLERDERRELAYTYLTRADLSAAGVSEAEAEGIANFLNNLANAKIALVLKETADGKIKGSFRTTRDDTDVAALARQLGGGGHKKAAGFSATGSIPEVLNKILTGIKE
ncbi:MAG: bifunctional oligoribonuclease/PAP phosphatase NrnA [Candidatus Magasanikbacteria bacterium]|nr:bifunctional oligoribonuclease/PAP phosphatase NrnA [Candidatus Magasanikbacteria bacterium]